MIAPVNRYVLLFGFLMSELILVSIPFVIFFIIAYILFPINIFFLLLVILGFLCIAIIFGCIGLILGILIITKEGILVDFINNLSENNFYGALALLHPKLKEAVAYVGLLLCATYMVIGFLQLQRAQSLAEDSAIARGHESKQLLVKPTLGNLVLWRSVYIHDNRIYVDAIRVGLFSANKVFNGSSVEKFSLYNDLPGLVAGSTLHTDIERFIKFSDGYVAFDPKQENVLGDIRYSMLPVSPQPLWGIVIDPEQPQQHADYRFFRDKSRAVRQKFFNLLAGNCAAVDC